MQTSLYSRTVKVPGSPEKVPGRDGTGQDLETLKVPWTQDYIKKFKTTRTFFKGPGTSWLLFSPCISQEFAKSTLVSFVEFINEFKLSKKPTFYFIFSIS